MRQLAMLGAFSCVLSDSGTPPLAPFVETTMMTGVPLASDSAWRLR